MFLLSAVRNEASDDGGQPPLKNPASAGFLFVRARCSVPPRLTLAADTCASAGFSSSVSHLEIALVQSFSLFLGAQQLFGKDGDVLHVFMNETIA